MYKDNDDIKEELSALFSRLDQREKEVFFDLGANSGDSIHKFLRPADHESLFAAMQKTRAAKLHIFARHREFILAEFDCYFIFLHHSRFGSF